MNKPYLKIKKLKDAAIVPSKREEDAGFDLYGVFDKEVVVLKSGEIYLIPTGLAMELPKDWVFYIAERGSTGSKGIAKRAGIVDSGYRGEVFVATSNVSNKTVLFAKYPEKMDEFLKQNNLKAEQVTIYPQSKAIAQGLLLYCPHVVVEVVSELSSSERGTGALGSSKK